MLWGKFCFFPGISIQARRSSVQLVEASISLVASRALDDAAMFVLDDAAICVGIAME